MSVPTQSSTIGPYGSKSFINPSVSHINCDGRSFGSITLSRLAPRGRVRHREGESDGPRYDLMFHSQGLLNPRPAQLRGSKFSTPEDLIAFSQKFDEGVKRLFSNDQLPQYVKFGSPRDNNAKCGIKSGRLTLSG